MQIPVRTIIGKWQKINLVYISSIKFSAGLSKRSTVVVKKEELKEEGNEDQTLFILGTEELNDCWSTWDERSTPANDVVNRIIFWSLKGRVNSNSKKEMANSSVVANNDKISVQAIKKHPAEWSCSKELLCRKTWRKGKRRVWCKPGWNTPEERIDRPFLEEMESQKRIHR